MKEIMKCKLGDQDGWKYGDGGKCYIGIDAKQRAMRERGKDLGRQYSQEPKSTTVQFLEKHEKRKKEMNKERNKKTPKKT